MRHADRQYCERSRGPRQESLARSWVDPKVTSAPQTQRRQNFGHYIRRKRKLSVFSVKHRGPVERLNLSRRDGKAEPPRLREPNDPRPKQVLVVRTMARADVGDSRALEQKDPPAIAINDPYDVAVGEPLKQLDGVRGKLEEHPIRTSVRAPRSIFRSTGCRIPPLRKYCSSTGVSMRQTVSTVGCDPSRHVARTVTFWPGRSAWVISTS